MLNIKFTKEEIQLLLQLMDRVPTSGLNAMSQVISLATKLSRALEAGDVEAQDSLS